MKVDHLNAHQLPYDVLIVGLAREGLALARFLVHRGARVVVTDAKPAELLADAVASLADLPVRYALGEHPLNLLESTDLIFVSPGVPPNIPLLTEARRQGLPISAEPKLFAQLCPATIVGITGSSGKTTTTALTGEMLKADGRKVWVGGNIGHPLIGSLSEIQAQDAVVMELSSFQLELFAPWPPGVGDHLPLDAGGWSPPIAAVLNITPNHLDRHPSMEAYTAAKAHILNYQQPGQAAILGRDNPITRQMGQALPHDRQVFWFSLEEEGEGSFLRGHELFLRRSGQEQRICRLNELQLLGGHNVANVLAAIALAAVAGASTQAIRQAAVSFRGVEHRLELVRARNGVSWYNDSIATAPERTVAALKAFDQPVVLLAGGRDKHLPWAEAADLTLRRARHLILFGEAADLIEAAMGQAAARLTDRKEPTDTPIHRAENLEHAVQIAARLAQPGDVVLLSPGCTSFDAYTDFCQRGEHFRQLVSKLES